MSAIKAAGTVEAGELMLGIEHPIVYVSVFVVYFGVITVTLSISDKK